EGERGRIALLLREFAGVDADAEPLLATLRRGRRLGRHPEIGVARGGVPVSVRVDPFLGSYRNRGRERPVVEESLRDAVRAVVDIQCERRPGLIGGPDDGVRAVVLERVPGRDRRVDLRRRSAVVAWPDLVVAATLRGRRFRPGRLRSVLGR